MLATAAACSAGIDVAKGHLDLCVLPGGASLRVPNDDAGRAALVGRLLALAAADRPGRVVVEATGGYERHLVDRLLGAGLPVALVNPLDARRFARASRVLAKNDRLDARVLAEFGRRVETRALAADADRDGSLGQNDADEVAARLGTSPAAPGTDPGAYDIFHDVDGSGAIDAADAAAVSAAAGATLPDGDPADPRVVGVLADATAWNATFHNYLASHGLGGAGGFAVPAGAGQLTPLPWINLDRVRIQFSEDVSLTQGALTVTGEGGAQYLIRDFAYDPATFTATWTLPAAVQRDTLTLTLAGFGASGGVTDPDGHDLDGEWVDGSSAFPSGDTLAGGDFTFGLAVLPGDVDRSGVVHAADMDSLRAALGRNATTNPGTPPNDYTAFRDVDGTGGVNAFDVLYERIHTPTGAPTGVTATASGTTVTLSWPAVTDANTYNVYRVVGTGPVPDDAAPYASGLTTPAFTDAAAEVDTVYSYAVSGVNLGGEGKRSDPVSVSTVPVAPATFSAEALSDAKIQLIWEDTPFTEKGYRIEWSANGTDGWTLLTDADAGGFTYTDTTIGAANTRRYYRLTAHNDAGDAPAVTATAVTLPPVAPAAPSGVIANATSPTTFAVTWGDNSDNETGFEVQVYAMSGATLPEEAEPVAVNTVDAPANATGATVTVPSSWTGPAVTDYYVAVRAVNDRVTPPYYSPWSNVYPAGRTLPDPTVTAPDAPSDPRALGLFYGQGAYLYWSGPSGGYNGFEVEATPDGAGAVAEHYWVTTATNLYLRRPNVHYTLRLRAFNLGGFGGWATAAETDPQHPATTGSFALPEVPELTVTPIDPDAGLSYDVEVSYGGTTHNWDSWRLEVATDPYFADRPALSYVSTDTGQGQPYQIAGLDPHTTYYYRMIALTTDPATQVTRPATSPVKNATTTPTKSTVNVTEYQPVAREQRNPFFGPAFSPGWVKFTRDAGLEDELTVEYTLGGTASPNGDYKVGLDPTPGQVKFKKGEAVKYVYVLPEDDDAAEWTETAVFTLKESDNYTVGADKTTTVYIQDNDLGFKLDDVLVANYDDTYGNGITDYEETGPGLPETQDLYLLQLDNVPRDAKAGTSVTLNAPADKVNVYTTESKSLRLIGAAGDSEETWTDVTQVPRTLWVEAKAGSSSVGDVLFTLVATDAGPSPSGGTVTQKKTAINFQITAVDSPDGRSGDVKNLNRPWLVGQMVDLRLDIQAPADWLKQTKYHWNIAGNRLHDYIIASDASYATKVELAEKHTVSVGSGARRITGTREREVDFFWVSASASPEHRHVFVDVQGVGPDPLSAYTVATDFDIHPPVVTGVSAVIGTAGFNLPMTAVGLFGPAATAGIAWSAQVQLPSAFQGQAGRWAFVQKIEADARKIDATGKAWHAARWNGGWGLDTQFPYPAWDPDVYLPGGGWATGPTTHGTSDEPRRPFLPSDKEASYKFEAKTWLIFKAPGDNSHWVPIQACEWLFYVKATNTSQGWVLDPNTSERLIPFSTDKEVPTWTFVYPTNVPDEPA